MAEFDSGDGRWSVKPTELPTLNFHQFEPHVTGVWLMYSNYGRNTHGVECSLTSLASLKHGLWATSNGTRTRVRSSVSCKESVRRRLCRWFRHQRRATRLRVRRHDWSDHRDDLRGHRWSCIVGQWRIRLTLRLKINEHVVP
jgi:hypothetical protein